MCSSLSSSKIKFWCFYGGRQLPFKSHISHPTISNPNISNFKISDLNISNLKISNLNISNLVALQAALVSGNWIR